jgi:hypothetical protein
MPANGVLFAQAALVFFSADLHATIVPFLFSLLLQEIVSDELFYSSIGTRVYDRGCFHAFCGRNNSCEGTEFAGTG